jgi:hypothetical protein
MSTQVSVAWNAVPYATSYEVDRRAAGGAFEAVGTSTTNAYIDDAVTAEESYLYRVRAINATGASPDSADDLATTVLFTNEPLVPQTTTVQAAHLAELRTAVNAVRLLAGHSPASFTGAAVPGVAIAAVHVTQLRSALDAALDALGRPTGGYTNSAGAGLPIRTVHFQEIRDRVQ